MNLDLAGVDKVNVICRVSLLINPFMCPIDPLLSILCIFSNGVMANYILEKVFSEKLEKFSVVMFFKFYLGVLDIGNC